MSRGNDRIYRREARTGEVIADLRTLGARTQRRAMLRTLLLLACYAALPAGGVIFVILMENWLADLAVAAAFGSFVSFGLLIWLRIISKRWELDVRRPELCRELIGALELAPDDPIRVEVNVDLLETPQHKTGGQDDDGLYRDTAARIEGRLSQGVAFSFRRDEDLIVRTTSFTRAQASGGHTTYERVTLKNRNWRFVDTLELRLPPESYRGAARLARAHAEAFQPPRSTSLKAFDRSGESLFVVVAGPWKPTPTTELAPAAELFRNLNALIDADRRVVDDRLIPTNDAVEAEERHRFLTRTLSLGLCLLLIFVGFGALGGAGYSYARSSSKIRKMERTYSDVIRSRGCTIENARSSLRCGLPESCRRAIDDAFWSRRDRYRKALMLLTFGLWASVAGVVLALVVRARRRRGVPYARLKPLVVACLLWIVCLGTLGTSFGLYTSSTSEMSASRWHRVHAAEASERNQPSLSHRRVALAERSSRRSRERSNAAGLWFFPGAILLVAGSIALVPALRVRRKKRAIP